MERVTVDTWLLNWHEMSDEDLYFTDNEHEIYDAELPKDDSDNIF